MKTIRQQETGVLDKNLNEIKLGDTVMLFGLVGDVTFDAGTYGIAFNDNIDWDKLSSKIKEETDCDNEPSFCMCDNFVSLWELLWNYNCEENCCHVIEIIEHSSQINGGV